jgi:hypothetical protein
LNRTNIRALARRLRSPSVDQHFDLGEYLTTEADTSTPIGQAIHECGTVACIAGFAAIMATPKSTARGAQVQPIAQEFLGLTDEEADKLFIPAGFSYSVVTRFVAADTLDHFADTGEIKWEY